MKNLIEEIKKPILKELQEFDVYFRDSIKNNIKIINILMNFIYRRKGKQLRPIIVILSAGLNGEINKSTYLAATMIELLHTATLIHDDIVDNSFERRGFFSLNALWKNKYAVLIGDYLLSRGLLLSLENNEFEMLKIISRAVKEMSEGELLQLKNLNNINITEDLYYEISRKKTASFFASCCAVGSYSSNKSNQKIIETMWKIGELIGIAFQIKDDLLDFEESNTIGKSSKKDLKEKKLTLPVIHAIEKSTFHEKKLIIKYLNNPTKSNLNNLLEIIQEKRGIEYSQERMKDFINSALDILYSNFTSNDYTKSFEILANYIILRKK